MWLAWTGEMYSWCELETADDVVGVGAYGWTGVICACEVGLGSKSYETEGHLWPRPVVYMPGIIAMTSTLEFTGTKPSL
jgi:hypothetical protein